MNHRPLRRHCCAQLRRLLPGGDLQRECCLPRTIYMPQHHDKYTLCRWQSVSLWNQRHHQVLERLVWVHHCGGAMPARVEFRTSPRGISRLVGLDYCPVDDHHRGMQLSRHFRPETPTKARPRYLGQGGQEARGPCQEVGDQGSQPTVCSVRAEHSGCSVRAEHSARFKRRGFTAEAAQGSQ